jgi:predicted nuclease with TOPRIM domain
VDDFALRVIVVIAGIKTKVKKYQKRGRRMPKLYELTGQYRNLVELLDDPAIDGQVVLEAAIGIEAELTDKAQNIAKLLKNIDSDIEAVKCEKKRLAEMQSALENKYDNLKIYLETNLKQANLKKIAGIVPLAFRKCPPSVEIIDPNLLPPECVIVKKEPDKKAIKELLMNGHPVNGAVLVTDKEYLKVG